MLWSNQFTIALVEGNPAKLHKLVQEMPHFEDKQEAIRAHALLKQAIHYMKTQQNEVKGSMEKIKKAQAFLHSAIMIPTHKKEYRG